MDLSEIHSSGAEQHLCGLFVVVTLLQIALWIGGGRATLVSTVAEKSVGLGAERSQLPVRAVPRHHLVQPGSESDGHPRRW